MGDKTIKTAKCAYLNEAFSKREPFISKNLDIVLEFFNSEPSRIMCPLYERNISGDNIPKEGSCGYNNLTCFYKSWKSLK
jgi:hypothetical protein